MSPLEVNFSVLEQNFDTFYYTLQIGTLPDNVCMHIFELLDRRKVKRRGKKVLIVFLSTKTTKTSPAFLFNKTVIRFLLEKPRLNA